MQTISIFKNARTWTPEIERAVARRVRANWPTTVLDLAEKLMGGLISQEQHDQRIFVLKQVELRFLKPAQICTSSDRVDPSAADAKPNPALGVQNLNEELDHEWEHA